MDRRTIADRYELSDRLGAGGSGTVWRARDLELGRVVAVKEIELPDGESEEHRAHLRSRALREARAAALVEHPNVVSVFDVHGTEDAIHIVMEHVDAPSLKQLLDEDGPMEPHRVAQLGLDVLAALEAAHAAGVLHRDVKPSNLLVTGDRTMVTDFGIASVRGGTSLTSTDQALGTPDYVSPEQVSDEPLGPATDLWGLGTTLYEAVEGAPPFRRDLAIATVHAVVSEPPRRTSRAGRLEPVLLELLSKEPGDRPDVDVARTHLRQVLDGEAPVPTAAMASLDSQPAEASTPSPVPPGVHPPSSGDTPATNPPPPTTPPVTPDPHPAVEVEPGHRHRGMRIMAVVVLALLVLVLAVSLASGASG